MEPCKNPRCRKMRVPNQDGGNSDHCGRCYMYARRHNGELPGPIVEKVQTRSISIRVPIGVEERLAKLGIEKPLATWASEEALKNLEQLEARKAKR